MTMPVCGGVEAYNEQSLCVKTSFYESTPPAQDPMGNKISSGAQGPLFMLQKNVITEVPPDIPGFYSNVFLVHKALGGWCRVIDLKQLNTHIYTSHFRMHTISSVLSTIEKEDYVFKIDLQDVHFHVLIHPDSRKFLCFPSKTRYTSFTSTSLWSEHCP